MSDPSFVDPSFVDPSFVEPSFIEPSFIEPSFVYLASQSPRRRDLLDQVHVAHVVLPPSPGEDVEALEVRLGRETPRRYVRRVAGLKADAALARIERGALRKAPVLVADTTVALGQRILGKPRDDEEARRMLRELSGRTHIVLTAVVVAVNGERDEALSESRVRFGRLTDEEIETYCATGEPFGKAGAYAIQGRAAVFVERIAGSHSGIVGLPLFETMRLLRRFGIASR